MKTLKYISLLIVGALLSIYSVAYAYTALGTYQGGTGTTTSPTLGQVLIGRSDGTYGPQATSSLGITGGGGGGSGTVTSVGASVPTGLSISGSPITTSGTLAFTLSNGYVIPLTASTTEWANASASTTALTPSYIRGLFSNTATGLTYSNSTGVTILTAGYVIPLSASTTQWANAYASTSAITGTSPIVYNVGTGVISCPTCNVSSSNVNSVSNVDGTLTISPTTGAVVSSLNLSHVNSWSGGQTFTNATTTKLFLSGTFTDSTNASGTLGQLLQSTGTSTLWVATSSLGISGSLSGGTKGFVTAWSTPTTVTSGALIDNGTVAGIGATSSTYMFNIQGTGGTRNLLNLATSTGTSVFNIDNAGNATLLGSLSVPAQVQCTGLVFCQIQSVNTDIDYKVVDGTKKLSFTVGTTDVITANSSGVTLGGGTPSMGTCGTSPSISGNDNAGKVTVGSGVVTSCAVVFGTTKSGTPHVFITVDGVTAVANSVSSVSGSGFTANFAATLGGGTFDYLVILN